MCDFFFFKVHIYSVWVRACLCMSQCQKLARASFQSKVHEWIHMILQQTYRGLREQRGKGTFVWAAHPLFFLLNLTYSTFSCVQKTVSRVLSINLQIDRKINSAVWILTLQHTSKASCRVAMGRDSRQTAERAMTYCRTSIFPSPLWKYQENRTHP